MNDRHAIGKKTIQLIKLVIHCHTLHNTNLALHTHKHTANITEYRTKKSQTKIIIVVVVVIVVSTYAKGYRMVIRPNSVIHKAIDWCLLNTRSLTF